MATVSTHPDTKTLQAYLHSDSHPSELERHVDDCEPCQDRLDRLAGDASLCCWDNEIGESNLKNSDINDRYRLLSRIGRGGMGVVYRAWDKLLQRTVAIKINNFLCSDRFAQEAEICARLQHPGIVPVHDFGTIEGGRSFIAMKLVQGTTLRQRLSEPETKQQILLQEFRQICQTMAYVHGEGVVHRDLKPDNILVGPFGETQIMDWGIAVTKATTSEVTAGLAVDHESAVGRNRENSPPKSAGHGIGTKPYMSPEQTRGDALDYRTDVYALGVILTEVLSGQPIAKIDLHVDACAAVTEVLAACDADEQLLDIARVCISEDANDRYSDAGVLEQQLERYFEIRRDSLKAAELQRVRAETRAEAERKRRSFVVVASLVIFSLIVFSVVTGACVALQEHQKVLQAEGKLIAASNLLAENEPATLASLDRTQHLIGELEALPSLILQNRSQSVESKLSALRVRSKLAREELDEIQHIDLVINRIVTARQFFHRANVGFVRDAANQCIDQYDRAFSESGVRAGMDVSDAAQILSCEYCSSSQRNQLLYGIHEWRLLTYFASGKKAAAWHRKLCDRVDGNSMRKAVWRFIENKDETTMKQLTDNPHICRDEVAVLLASTFFSLKRSP